MAYYSGDRGGSQPPRRPPPYPLRDTWMRSSSDWNSPGFGNGNHRSMQPTPNVDPDSEIYENIYDSRWRLLNQVGHRKNFCDFSSSLWGFTVCPVVSSSMPILALVKTTRKMSAFSQPRFCLLFFQCLSISYFALNFNSNFWANIKAFYASPKFLSNQGGLSNINNKFSISIHFHGKICVVRRKNRRITWDFRNPSIFFQSLLIFTEYFWAWKKIRPNDYCKTICKLWVESNDRWACKKWSSHH